MLEYLGQPRYYTHTSDCYRLDFDVCEHSISALPDQRTVTVTFPFSIITLEGSLEKYPF